MGRTSANQRMDPEKGPTRYHARVVSEAHPTDRGLVYCDVERHDVLDWERIRHAIVAEVGEPEGVRALVLDLVIEIGAEECHALRTGLECGDEATCVARAVEERVGKRCDSSVRSLATEGVPHLWYPDLLSLEESVLETIRFGGLAQE